MYLAWSARTGRGLSQNGRISCCVWAEARVNCGSTHGKDDLGNRRVDDQDVAGRIIMIFHPYSIFEAVSIRNREGGSWRDSLGTNFCLVYKASISTIKG